MNRVPHPRAREVDVYEAIAIPTLIAILLAAAFFFYDALTAEAQDSTEFAASSGERSSTGLHPRSGHGNGSAIDEGALREARQSALVAPDIATLHRVTTLARALIAESDYSAADHVAQLYVLQRRADEAGVPIERMAEKYVSAFKLKEPTPRLRYVL
jgi:hypothetical protein